jgi:hypothetical protein
MVDDDQLTQTTHGNGGDDIDFGVGRGEVEVCFGGKPAHIMHFYTRSCLVLHQPTLRRLGLSDPLAALLVSPCPTTMLLLPGYAFHEY